MQRSRYFRIDWVLVDQLAIGPAPRAERHLDRLHEAGLRCILSLRFRRSHTTCRLGRRVPNQSLCAAGPSSWTPGHPG